LFLNSLQDSSVVIDLRVDVLGEFESVGVVVVPVVGWFNEVFLGSSPLEELEATLSSSVDGVGIGVRDSHNSSWHGPVSSLGQNNEEVETCSIA